MASVDDRVVQMEFDNRSFGTAVAATLSMLDKLKSALSFSASKNGIEDVQASANKFSLAGVSSGIDAVNTKFSALSIAGVTALATIANKAIEAGLQFGKSFTTAPIKAGFDNYETQINAVQTILANTGLQGQAGLAQVNKALGDLNTYANQTVYNFSQMAASIGTFTAAGVKLDPATAAIKGIANLAAASGASADQASGAMYQLSQALAAGTFKLQDYNSVVNAGIGGKLFQTAIFNSAVAAKTLTNVKVGETYDEWTAAGNNFRSSLQDGYVTTTVLSNALASFTGDQTAAQLKTQGYTDAQIAYIQATAKTAVNAATQIKTLSQLSSALKEEVATAYGAIFKTIFGDINGATALFSKLHTVAENALTNPIYALNSLLEGAAALGARDNVIKGFTNTFHALSLILGAVKEAFRQIFPATTAKQINDVTLTFANFTEKLIPSQKTIDGIRRTVVGLFAVLDIGKTLIKDVLHVLVVFLSSFSGNGASDGIFRVTANISDFLVKLDDMVKHGEGVRDFFTTLGDKVTIPAVLLKRLADIISTLFSGFKTKDSNAVNDSLHRMQSALEPIANAFDRARDAIANFLKPITQELKPALDAAVNLFATLGDNIATALQNQDFTGINKILQTGLLAGIFLTIKKFLSKGLTISPTGGVIDSIKESFEGLTGTLKTMQLELKARALEEIAVAIALLTASVVALSFVNGDNLSKSLKAMAVGFGELLGGLAVLTKIAGGTGTLKLPVLAASLVVLASALLVMTGAVAILGNLKYETLEKGLTAVGILLAAMVGAALILSKNSGGLVAAGVGITAMAVAMNILAGAVAIFGNMDLETLGKGLGAVIVALVGIALAMKLMPNGASLALQGAGLVLIALALEGIAGVVATFATMKYDTIAKGIGSIALALVAIGLAMRVMPNGASLALQGVGLVLIAAALEAIVGVIATLGSLNYESLGKGIGALAVTLGVLAIALKVMQSSIAGAASLAIVTLALKELVPVIQSLANMKWSDIAKGIGVMAISLGVLIAAGYAAEGAALGLAALALAALGLGAGIGLAGAGVGALATGLGKLINLGGAGISVLLKTIAAVISQIPALATAFAVGLIDILKVIGDNGPAIIQAFGTIIGSLLTAVTENIPKLATLIETLIEALLQILTNETPNVIAAGIKLIEDLLTGITSALPTLVTEAANLIITFLGALAQHAPDIIAAGVGLLVALLLGIANSISTIVDAVTNIITTFITAIGNAVGQIITAGADMIVNLVTGLGQNADKIVTAGADAMINFINGLGQNSARIVNAAGNAILQFLIALDSAINTYEPAIIKECEQIGKDMIKGVLDGLGDVAKSIGGKITGGLKSAASNTVSFVTGGLLGSPYKIGKAMTDGIAGGVEKTSSNIEDSLQNNVKSVISNVAKTIGSASLPDLNLNPTIAPILDLSNVKSGASKLQDMIGTSSIDVTTAFSQASAISAFQQEASAAAASTETTTPTPVQPITFEQNNYSPKALSPVEIYRNTKTQLNLAKEALAAT